MDAAQDISDEEVVEMVVDDDAPAAPTVKPTKAEKKRLLDAVAAEAPGAFRGHTLALHDRAVYAEYCAVGAELNRGYASLPAAFRSVERPLSIPELAVANRMPQAAVEELARRALADGGKIVTASAVACPKTVAEKKRVLRLCLLANGDAAAGVEAAAVNAAPRTREAILQDPDAAPTVKRPSVMNLASLAAQASVEKQLAPVVALVETMEERLDGVGELLDAAAEREERRDGRVEDVRNRVLIMENKFTRLEKKLMGRLVSGAPKSTGAVRARDLRKSAERLLRTKQFKSLGTNRGKALFYANKARKQMAAAGPTATTSSATDFPADESDEDEDISFVAVIPSPGAEKEPALSRADLTPPPTPTPQEIEPAQVAKVRQSSTPQPKAQHSTPQSTSSVVQPPSHKNPPGADPAFPSFWGGNATSDPTPLQPFAQPPGPTPRPAVPHWRDVVLGPAAQLNEDTFREPPPPTPLSLFARPRNSQGPKAHGLPKP